MQEDIQRLIKTIQDKTKQREELVNREFNIQADMDNLQSDLDEIQKNLTSLDEEIEDDEDELLALVRGEE